MKYLKTYKLYEAHRFRNDRNLDLVEKYKEDALDFFYDLMDLGYEVQSSCGQIMTDIDTTFYVNYSLRITKRGPVNAEPFMMSEIVDDVDRFIDYIGELPPGRTKNWERCRVSLYNYEESQEFEKDYGKFHTWYNLKQNLETYYESWGATTQIDTLRHALVTSFQVYYRIDL